MKTRGFTLVELLVSMGLFITAAALVYAGVRPQMKTVGSTVRVATMQQTARGAFDLLARDLRMAGYGVDLTMPGVPPPVRIESGYLVALYGNFSNVKTSGTGAGSTITVPSTAGFATNNYVVIRGFLGGEAALIAGVGSTTITLSTPLTRVYGAGSQVYQIEHLRYSLSSGTALREGQPMLDGIQSLTFQYYLDDGTLVTNPAGVEKRVLSTLITLQTNTVDRPAGVTNETMAMQAEIRIRNLGLLEVKRSS